MEMDYQLNELIIILFMYIYITKWDMLFCNFHVATARKEQVKKPAKSTGLYNFII